MKKQTTDSEILHLNFKKLTLFFILIFAFAANSLSQTPQHYNYNTTLGANSFPFSVAAGKEVQWLVKAGEFNQPSGVPSGQVITTLWFYMASTSTPTYTTFTIKLGQDINYIQTYGTGGLKSALQTQAGKDILSILSTYF